MGKKDKGEADAGTGAPQHAAPRAGAAAEAAPGLEAAVPDRHAVAARAAAAASGGAGGRAGRRAVRR
jgi:hypothetical protein